MVVFVLKELDHQGCRQGVHSQATPDLVCTRWRHFDDIVDLEGPWEARRPICGVTELLGGYAVPSGFLDFIVRPGIVCLLLDICCV